MGHLFHLTNFISERSSISLNQETPEASNVCHELCKPSKNDFHFDWQLCDTTTVVLFRQ